MAAGIWRDVKGARVPRRWYSVERPDVYNVSDDPPGEVGAWPGIRFAELGGPRGGTLYERVSLLDGRRLCLVRGPGRRAGEWEWHALGGLWGAHVLNSATRDAHEVRAHWRGYVELNVIESGPVQVWMRYRPIP